MATRGNRGRQGSLQYPSILPEFVRSLTSRKLEEKKPKPAARRRRGGHQNQNPLMALTKVASLHSGAYFGEMPMVLKWPVQVR